MKNNGNLFSITIFAILLWAITLPYKGNAQGYGQVSFDIFYNELSPYGHWDNDSHYGDIWFPNVEANFTPYGTNGYWTMTNYGNTWVSNYPWGWAPFHYGRWVHTSYRGWGWIPGYEWGPAWVDWRSGNGYYGWAPMAPSISVNVSIGLPINLWVFAPSRQIYNRNIYRYCSYGRPNIYNRTTIINNTYIVNNNHYYGGPSRRDVERTLGRRVAVRDVHYTDRPSSSRTGRNSVSIYRPDRNSNKNDRIVSTDRNSRYSDNRNGGTNRISREMYIDKNGNSTIRERSPEVNRDNNIGYSNYRNENRNNGTNRTSRDIFTGRTGNRGPIERGSETTHNNTRQPQTSSSENSNNTSRTDVRTRRTNDESSTSTRNRMDQNPMRTPQTRNRQSENGSLQENNQSRGRRSSNSIYYMTKNSDSRSNGSATSVNRSSSSPSVSRSSQRRDISTPSSNRRNTENFESRRNR